MPIELGSTTPNTAAVAIAASMAFPPFASICTPAKVASGWLDATMPFFAITEKFSAMRAPLPIYSDKINRAISLGISSSNLEPSRDARRYRYRVLRICE